MGIFDELTRTDASPRHYSEPLIDFLNRINRPAFEETRSLIDRWFSEYCSAGQADIRGRMRSRDDRQFQGAFWELYIHQTLLRSDYDITCHPSLPGTSRQPDFRAVGSESLLLEARLAWLARDELIAESRRDRLYDAINKVRSPNFFLDVGVEAFGNAEATGLRPLRRDLEAWLDGLDPDQVAGDLEAHGVTSLPAHQWHHGGWQLEFRALPVSDEYRGAADHRPIGISSGPGGRIEGIEPLRSALSDKVNAYGAVDEPFIIAVRTDWRTDRADIASALFGTRQIAYTQGLGRNNQVWYVRKDDGLWSGGRNNHVAAVLISNEIVPWTITSNVPTLWENPNADHPVRALGVWERAIIRDNNIDFVPASQTMHELLGLPAEWPPGMIPG